MSDWAKKANEKLEKEEADKRAADQTYALQRAQLNAEAPRLWEALKESLFREVTAFSKLGADYLSMDADYQGLPKIIVRTDKAILAISFDAKVPQIDYTRKSPNGMSESSSGYLFEISDGKVAFTSTNFRNAEAQVVAEELLDKLV